MGRVLAVGLDAADAGLVLGWAREGSLPMLGSLLASGSVARLRSRGDVFPESAWPTISTGLDVGGHGVYNWRTVRPGTYERGLAPLGRDAPFWAGLESALVVDVPYTAPLRRDGLTEIAAWGQRGASAEASWPAGLLDEVRSRHGAYPPWVHFHHHRGSLGSVRMLRTLERMAGVRTDLVSRLMASVPWSLCLVNYSETHNAGHEFQRWLDPEAWSRRGGRGSHDGLLRVYRAADEGLRRLVAAAGPDADVVVFSGMGLTRNGASSDLLGAVVERLGYQVRPEPGAGGLAARPVQLARRVLPWSVRRLLHFRLSPEQQERVMVGIWLGSIDWQRSRAFAESEPHGWIRLNVRGREPSGIVAPGAEYDALRSEIARELERLVDADTGRPVVDAVLRREDVADPDEPRYAELPDLVVRWANDGLFRAVRHPTAGVVAQNVADVPYTEHTASAFAVLSGPSVRAGASASGSLLDLAPTLLTLLGEEVPAVMPGRPLDELLVPAAADDDARAQPAVTSADAPATPPRPGPSAPRPRDAS